MRLSPSASRMWQEGQVDSVRVETLHFMDVEELENWLVLKKTTSYAVFFKDLFDHFHFCVPPERFLLI